MKAIILIAITLFITGCAYTTSEAIEYRQVSVSPTVESVIFDTVNPVDVTTTSITYY